MLLRDLELPLRPVVLSFVRVFCQLPRCCRNLGTVYTFLYGFETLQCKRDHSRGDQWLFSCSCMCGMRMLTHINYFIGGGLTTIEVVRSCGFWKVSLLRNN